jgi:hypothetical protein
VYVCVVCVFVLPLLLPLILLLLIAPVQVQVQGKTQVQRRGVLGDGLKARENVDAVDVVVVVGAKAEV